jgi:hypothetical protein
MVLWFVYTCFFPYISLWNEWFYCFLFLVYISHLFIFLYYSSHNENILESIRFWDEILTSTGIFLSSVHGCWVKGIGTQSVKG